MTKHSTTASSGVFLYAPDDAPSAEPEATRRSSALDHPHTLLSTPSSRTVSVSRRLPPPPEGSGIRTTFTSRLSPGRPFEVYEDPIMEEYFPDKLHPQPLNVRSRTSLVASVSIVVAAAIGVGLGVGLMQLHVDASSDWPKWLALPGDLFVRALRCLIVPMVFCSMAVAIAEIVLLEKTALLSWRTGAVYFLTSLLATLQGITVAYVYHLVASHGVAKAPAPALPTNIALQCANKMYLAVLGSNGSIGCIEANPNATTALFTLSDASHGITLASKQAVSQLSLSDQVISIFNLVVPENIFASFASGSLLSIIAFALPLGFVIAKTQSDANHNYLLVLLRQTRNAILVLIDGLLRLTPIAVLFLLASAIVSYKIKEANAAAFGYVFLAFLSGVVSHVLLVMPLFLFLFTRCNPYKYLRHLVPAYVFAFGCASSMATLPVAVTVVHQTRQVSRSLAQLILCLGTPTNMNAAGLYQPVMTVFMAHMSGIDDQLRGPQWVVLFFVALIGSMGTAPVPNAGLVMLLTVWKTVFPSATQVPPAFAIVMAVDFLFDRIRTMTNVNGNMVVARMLADRFNDDLQDSIDDDAAAADRPIRV
ncbi:hypothetical protein SDRG_02005 [Saprolegnia diclina VS20]|uniref:Amino acid transporter n=1 Tax=Saprolegnia diclina (strain VS20) TaxID=1156394 RepID=T0SDD1_SAPDV|nr:hypothetical protein SDRG_02005 [Saprolegnia diclina VS20]EQC40942.1 hypothetical protein SDRG_02005 [Saprolegnia diclina VS20]|eukprot:XP_008605786.1 hypothetical protein SDRG_02005 [Saprolegnia diclina VS20]